MIRLLLSISVLWWLAFYFYPVETLVLWSALGIRLAHMALVEDAAKAEVIRG